MGGISLSQVQSLPDILDQTRFVLQLGILPGGLNTEELTVRCFAAAIPGTSNEFFETNMGGHQRKFRGRKMYPRILPVSFYEDVRMDTFNKLLSWDQMIAGTESGNSAGYQSDYTITAELEVYDTAGVLASTFRMHRFAIADTPDTNLSTESSMGVQVQAQFTYDYYTSSTFAMR